MPKNAGDAAGEARPSELKRIPLVWVGLEDMPARAVTNVISQIHEGMFLVTLGFTNPPVLLGTKSERAKQAEKISAVPVTPVARITMTVEQMEKTIKALQTNLKNFKKLKGGAS